MNYMCLNPYSHYGYVAQQMCQRRVRPPVIQLTRTQQLLLNNYLRAQAVNYYIDHGYYPSWAPQRRK